jgi:hypothetical protein
MDHDPIIMDHDLIIMDHDLTIMDHDPLFHTNWTEKRCGAASRAGVGSAHRADRLGCGWIPGLVRV